MKGVGCRVQGVGCEVQGVGCVFGRASAAGTHSARRDECAVPDPQVPDPDSGPGRIWDVDPDRGGGLGALGTRTEAASSSDVKISVMPADFIGKEF